MEELYELPDGWVWTTLPAMSDIVMGQSPPSSTYPTIICPEKSCIGRGLQQIYLRVVSMDMLLKSLRFG